VPALRKRRLTVDSLRDLNAFGQTSLEFTDTRPAGIVSNLNDAPQNKNVVIEVIDSDTTVNQIFEIFEIINYNVADVVFEVEIIKDQNPIPDVSIEWNFIPTYMTLSEDGLIYRISGFQDEGDWQTVSTFTWLTPLDRESYDTWYLECRVKYFDGRTNQIETINWDVYDPDHYIQSKLRSISAMNVVGGIQEDLSSNLSVNTVLRIVTPADSTTAMNFDMVIDAGEIHGPQFTQLGFNFDLIANGGYLQVFQNSTFANAILTAQGEVLAATENIDITRGYLSNQANNLFTNNIPFIIANDSFSYEFTASNGTFGFDEQGDTATLTLSGTNTELNNSFGDIIYYPPKDFTSTDTITYKQFKDGSLIFQSSFSATRQGTGGIALEKFEFLQSATFTPTFIQQKYGTATIYLLGGGGGGGYAQSQDAASGGAGGQYRIISDLAITQSSYNIVVGAGGAGQDNTPSLSRGINGGDTSAFGFTASGGQGGEESGLGTRGGNNTQFSGSEGTTNSSIDPLAGGGGAGAGGNAETLPSTSNDPRDGGPATDSDIPDSFITNVGGGGQGGTGYRPEIGANGTGARGSVGAGAYGTGGGGGGGQGAGEEIGGNGTHGIAAIIVQ